MISKLYFTMAAITAASISMASAQQTPKVTASGIGYLEYLPEGYHSNSNRYPLVISLHGVREKGTPSTTDRQRIIADLQRVDNVGLPKYVKFGQKYPFILISPQLKSNYGMWPGAYIIEVLNYVKKYLRVDESRVYLTGLSLGGFGVWKTAGDYPNVFAAIAPVCPGGNAMNKAAAIAAANLPVWGFHGGSDKVVSFKVTTNMVNAVNAKRPKTLAKATIFPGMGHGVWDKAYNQTSLLTWMLSCRKGSPPGANTGSFDTEESGNNSNTPPVVKAGPDQSLTLPSNSLYIQGSANDPDGKVVSVKWTKISGGPAGLSGTGDRKLRAYGLKAGTYLFRLTAEDDHGAVKFDEMKVYVKTSSTEKNTSPAKKPPGKNNLPMVSAGPDIVLTLPRNSVDIHARGTDKDGRIVAYKWEKTYGRRSSMAGASSPNVRIFNLDKGVYIFRVTATDNAGGTKDDYFKITVLGSDNNQQQATGSTPSGNRSNIRPIASAGPDRVLTLPANSIAIQSQASDKDGRIVSYEWTKTYGGRANLSGAHSPKVRIYNLAAGVYIFRLTVKDNDGGVRDDYFKITVKSAGKEVSRHTPSPQSVRNEKPVAYAGTDRKVSLSKGFVILHGSGRDADGKVVSYQWKKLSGPPLTIRNAETPQPTISGLKEGHYYFSLTVKDDHNAASVDKMALRVTGG